MMQICVYVATLLVASSNAFWDDWEDPSVVSRVEELRALRRQRGVEIREFDLFGSRVLERCESDRERGAVNFELVEFHVQKGLKNPEKVEAYAKESLRFVESAPRRVALYCYLGDATRIQHDVTPEVRMADAIQWYARGLAEIHTFEKVGTAAHSEHQVKQMGLHRKVLVDQLRSLHPKGNELRRIWEAAITRAIEDRETRQSILAGMPEAPQAVASESRPATRFAWIAGINLFVIAGLFVTYRYWQR